MSLSPAAFEETGSSVDGESPKPIDSALTSFKALLSKTRLLPLTLPGISWFSIEEIENVGSVDTVALSV